MSDDKKTTATHGAKPAYGHVPIVLKTHQWKWLEGMASKHKLSSVSKAIRCCVNCVALGDANDAPASSGAIDSSIDSKNDDDDVTKQVELSDEQIFWLETKRIDHDQQKVEGFNFFSKEIIAPCMAMDEYVVFGVIRCKSSIAKCEGAQEAICNIGQQYNQKEGEVVVKENIDILSKECGCASGKK